MSTPAEAKLLAVLHATSAAISNGNWSDPAYEAAMDNLLAGKDDAALEAKVALMDFPVPAAYATQLQCVLATGGPRALHFLQLYSRCDIGPRNPPVKRDRSGVLRALTIKQWRTGHGQGSCEFE